MTYKKRIKATARVAEEAVGYQPGTAPALPICQAGLQGPQKEAGSRGWSFTTTSERGYVVLSRTESTAHKTNRAGKRKALGPDAEREPQEPSSLERALHFLRTAPHKRAKRSPETIARALALIGAGGFGTPADLSENLDDYLYGDKK